MKEIPAPQLVRIPEVLVVTSMGFPTTVETVQNIRSNEIWEQFLRVQIKEETQKTYRRAIVNFSKEVAPNRSPSDFLAEFFLFQQRQATQLVLDWRQSLIDRGLASATINQRLAAIKSLVAFASRAELCEFSLAAIKCLKSDGYRDTRGVPVEDYRSIMALVDRSTDLGIRNYAILRLLWDLALRRGEVISLDVSHYLPGKLMVLGKGKIDRQTLDIGGGLAEALDQWIAIRRGLYFQPKSGDQDLALFLSCTGRRLDGMGIWRIVMACAEAAGVKVSPHGIRHSAITAFLDASGGDVRSAQSLSRHKDPRTLMIYDDNRQGLQGKATQSLGSLLDSLEPKW
jgi:integrase/recombinase XerC